MEIRFRKADAEYVRVEELRRKIAKQTCVDPEFIEIVCDILLTINILTNDLSHKLNRALDGAQYKIADESLEAYKELKNLICNYYILIQDFGFDSELRAHNPDEYARYRLSDMERKMGVFRGVLFEAIVEELVRDRFVNQKFVTGSKVYIEGNLIYIFYDNGRKKETFDIVGWHQEKQYGEFYECKIQPDKFKQENYELMLKLEKELIYNMVKNYKLIVVSANSNNNFVNQISQMEKKFSTKLEKIVTYGKDTLAKIREIQLPESA